MKTITLEVTETVRYSQSFEVSDDFDTTDSGQVEGLWILHGLHDYCEVTERWITVAGPDEER